MGWRFGYGDQECDIHREVLVPLPMFLGDAYIDSCGDD